MATAESPVEPERDRIVISLPLDSRYVSTLRVLAASLAADAGFTVDEIEDLRLATSEVFSLMMAAHAQHGRVTTSFLLGPDSITMELSGDGAAAQPDELARSILAAVVDSYRFDATTVTLTKRAAEARSA